MVTLVPGKELDADGTIRDPTSGFVATKNSWMISVPDTQFGTRIEFLDKLKLSFSQ
jgi:hypothetical protein